MINLDFFKYRQTSTNLSLYIYYYINISVSTSLIRGEEMSLDKILDYYCTYENITKFMQNSLSKKAGEDYDISTLYDVNKIKKIINRKKVDKIFERLEKECYDISPRIRTDIQNILEGEEIEKLLNNLRFKYKKNIKKVAKYIEDIVLDDEIIICYPLIQNKDNKQPIITFVCSLKDNLLIVNEYFVNRESILIIFAYLLQCSTEEVEVIMEKEIKEIFKIFDEIQSQKSIDEIISIIDSEIFKRFKGTDINSILDFKEYDGWIKVEKIFITSEELDEIYTPIFKEEIKILREKFSSKSDVPSLLNKYILGNKEAQVYDVIKDDFKFHFGSYTDKYPINEKQWDVVGISDNIELLSVNGPPGTGKTTLLKEIIANNIVDKAKQLVEVWDEDWILINENFKQEVYESPFRGANRNSMVITSTNNLAVDNIGKELLEEIPYFSEFIDAGKNQGLEYKGMICARLGKKDNINHFKLNIFKPFIEELRKIDNYKENKDIVNEFKSVYKELNDIKNILVELFDRKKKLIKILNQNTITEQDLNDKLHSLNEDMTEKIQKMNSLERKIEETNATLFHQKQKLNNLSKQNNELHDSSDKLNNILKRYYIDLERFDKLEKFKFLKLFSKRIRNFFTEYPTKKYIEMQIERTKQKLEDYEIEIKNLDKSIQELSNDIYKLESLSENLLREQKNLNDYIRANRKLEKEIKEYMNKFFNVKQALCYNANFTDNIYNLVNCKKILTLRKRLFDLSLEVFQEYIKKHNKEIIKNLEKIFEDNKWFKSFYSPDQSFNERFTRGLKALWETFFICFPVVTTTLHSFAKHTFHILPNYIDYLLVDEAGQILPHYLVGPLYRVRKAIVVGDIYQLEPIRLYEKNLIDNSDIPENLHKNICVENNSAQNYADNHSDIYDFLNEGKKGIILDEHRRCEKSIIEFSNRNVYEDKLKVFKEDDHDKLFGRNVVAIDIRGKKTKNHINESEVRACEKIVNQLIAKYGNDVKKDIAIITPFRNQSKRLKNVIKNIDIGTIHTFQGQEKKYIIISTVIDSEKNHKLLNFVGGKPNLLNVSFTRAKEQVILVGNLEVALKSNNFLSKAVKTIQDIGLVYSIYDADLTTSNKNLDWNNVYRIVSDTEINTNTELGKYLKYNFRDNIIIGPSNHYNLLKTTLSTAKKSICIFSPWITNYVVNDEFKKLLSTAINSNVDIKICFGYKKTDFSIDEIEKIVQLDYSFNDYQKQNIYESIKFLGDKLGNNLLYKPPIHTKLLLVDEKFLFIGSHNWLSNSGNTNDERDEISCILINKETIEYVKERYISKFFE